MSAPHTHADTNKLTFGCEGCIQRVKDDQRAAEIAEAPERSIKVKWSATAHDSGALYITLPALPDEKASTVMDRNWSEIQAEIESVIEFGCSDWEIDAADAEFEDETKAETA